MKYLTDKQRDVLRKTLVRIECIQNSCDAPNPAAPLAEREIENALGTLCSVMLQDH
jgi:hypothetical protein